METQKVKNGAEVENDRVQAVHPLLVDLILDRIFDHIIGTGESSQRAKNVQNIRLVCKLWRNRMTALFRKSLYPTDLTSMKNAPLDSMRRFLNVMSESSMIPMNKYEIPLGILCEHNPDLIAKFFRVCLPDAVELELTYDDHNSLSCDISVNENFPKLQRLRVTCFPGGNRTPLRYARKPCPLPPSQFRDIPPLVQHIFNSAENIEEFELRIAVGESIFHEDNVQQITQSVCQKIPKYIKSFMLDIPKLSDNCLETLNERNLNLEKFRLSYSEIDCTNEIICNFFKMQSESLKTLRFGDTFDMTSISILISEFPALRNLTFLRLSQGNCSPMSITKTFPALVVLEVRTLDSSSLWEEILEKSGKVTSVKELHLPSDIPQAKLIRKIASCFPNVEKLIVSCYTDMAETLVEVFTYFTNIYELYINHHPLLETDRLNIYTAEPILSGIDKNDYNKIIEVENLDSVDFESFPRKPSLLNLTKLKKLSLVGHTFDFISNFLVQFVLLKMSSLRQLELPDLVMTRDYRNLLTSKMRVMKNKRPKNSFDDDCYSNSEDEDETSDSESDSDSDFWY